jgi:hypothetical protein
VAEWILQIVAHASGLVINMEKTEFFPIRCEGSGLTFLENNGQKRSSFPCTYLGLPLHVKKLPRSLFHQIIQKIGDKLPGSKRIFFSYPNIETLVKSVLSSLPTYFLSVFTMSKWGYKELIDLEKVFCGEVRI